MSKARANPIVVTETKNIPFHLLLKSSDNMRIVKPQKAADQQLIASIRAAGGVFQNLIVAPSADKPDHFEVHAGGRRFSAIAVLVKEGAFAKDHPVPCRVQIGGSTSAVSLAENLHAATHPADEFAAYAAMLKQGMSEAEIAEHFAVKQQHVSLRLKLAEVHPQILRAYRKGEINLETVMAFCMADTKTQQLSVFKECGKQCSAWRVRQALTGDGERSDSALARFVGLEIYKAAGGRLVTDLFEERAYLSDSDLLRQLACEKLDKSAERLRKREGWKTIDVGIDAARGIFNLNRLQPQPVGVPAEVTEALRQAVEERDAIEASDEEWTEASEAAFDALTNTIAALEKRIDSHREYTDEQKVTAKCVVSVGRNGKVQIDRGLVTRAQANRLQSGASENDNSKQGNALPNALANDLGAERQQIAQAALANDPKLAGDVLLYRLCQQVLGGSRWEEGAIEASFDSRLTVDDALAETKAAERLEKTRRLLITEWMSLESKGAQFAALRQLAPSEKNRLMAYCVSACLKVNFGAYKAKDSVTATILTDLQPDFAKAWRPSANNYFKRLRKAALLSHGKAWFGKVWETTHANAKKGELVATLDAFFNGSAPAGLDAKQKVIREQWLPKGFGLEATASTGD